MLFRSGHPFSALIKCHSSLSLVLEARHRDAAGLGGVVERRDEIALQAGRVVAGRWHAVLLSEFGIPRRNRRGGGAGFSERLKLPPIRL